MNTHTEGKFSVTSFDEKKHLEVDEERAVSRATIVQTYEGGLSAEATHELLMCYYADGTADTVGFARIVGSVGDRSGSWLEQSNGHFDGHTARGTSTIVKGSGKDGFENISGTGTNWSDKDGRTGYTLDYDLG